MTSEVVLRATFGEDLAHQVGPFSVVIKSAERTGRSMTMTLFESLFAWSVSLSF